MSTRTRIQTTNLTYNRLSSLLNDITREATQERARMAVARQTARAEAETKRRRDEHTRRDVYLRLVEHETEQLETLRAPEPIEEPVAPRVNPGTPFVAPAPPVRSWTGWLIAAGFALAAVTSFTTYQIARPASDAAPRAMVALASAAPMGTALAPAPEAPPMPVAVEAPAPVPPVAEPTPVAPVEIVQLPPANAEHLIEAPKKPVKRPRKRPKKLVIDYTAFDTSTKTKTCKRGKRCKK